MGINDEDVAAVRAASDIVAIVSQYTPLRRVGQRWMGLCPFHTEKTPVVRGQRRRERVLLLRLPGEGRRHHLRRGEGAARLPGRRRVARRQGQHHAPLHRPRPGRGPQEAGQAGRRGGQGRRLVPRPPAHRARRRRRPPLPAGAGPRRRRRARVPDRLGPRRLGRRCAARSAPPATCSSTPAWPGSTASAGSTTTSGPGSCSRSATTGATRSASAGGSSPAARGRATRASTRTRPRPRSTTSPRCSTGSTGPRRRSSPPAAP